MLKQSPKHKRCRVPQELRRLHQESLRVREVYLHRNLKYLLQKFRVNQQSLQSKAVHLHRSSLQSRRLLSQPLQSLLLPLLSLKRQRPIRESPSHHILDQPPEVSSLLRASQYGGVLARNPLSTSTRIPRYLQYLIILKPSSVDKTANRRKPQLLRQPENLQTATTQTHNRRVRVVCPVARWLQLPALASWLELVVVISCLPRFVKITLIQASPMIAATSTWMQV